MPTPYDHAEPIVGEVVSATKDEVIARLTEAHVALVGAADAMARRYGAIAQVMQLSGAALMIFDDWVPAIRRSTDHGV